MNHYHCTVIGYDEMTDDFKSFKGGCDVSLIGFLNEGEAIERTKKLIKKPKYHLARVWQCNTCPYQEAIQKAVELQGKFFKQETNEED